MNNESTGSFVSAVLQDVSASTEEIFMHLFGNSSALSPGLGMAYLQHGAVDTRRELLSSP